MKKNNLNKLAIGFLIASMMIPGPAAAFGAETSSTEFETQVETEAVEAAEEAAQEAAEDAAREAEEQAAREAAEQAAKEAEEKAAQEAAEQAAEEAAEQAAQEAREKAAQEAAEEAAQEAKENKGDAKEKAAAGTEENKDQETAEADQKVAEKPEETEKETETETKEGPDVKADVENEAAWKKTLPEKLAHAKENPAEADYRADIAAIAESQVGYKESIRNYVEYNDGTSAQYSRYGAWFGDNYADPWDAEFACFVLYYAGVPDVPYDGDTAKWTHKLAEKEMFLAADYEAKAGDLIFLQEKDGPFHVGIVTNADENKLTVVAGTVGESVDSVKSFSIGKNDSRIYAYGAVVPKDPEKKAEKEITETEAAEIETAEKEIAETEAAMKEDAEKKAAEKESAETESTETETTETESTETETTETVTAETKIALSRQTVDVSVYTDAKKEKTLDGVSITLEGVIPEKATVFAYPVNFSLEGEEMYAAYQVIILDENGNEYHQKAGEGERLALTINDPKLYQVFEKKESVHCWHKDGENIQDTSYKVLDNCSVVLYSDAI